MADKFDKNGYNSSDFKRNAPQDANMENDQEQDGEDNPKVNEKAGEYMRELLSEKIKLNNAKFPIVTKLIDQEVTKVQASGRIPGKDSKYLDVFRDKPTKVTVKVLVPVKEHPKFNFVGKLLGPKGNTMKHLQEETMCKMAVLGRGSMRDRQKEEELRNSLDPKYAHLTDELHVEISALAAPAEAHARIAYALAEVKKYLIPDTNDMIWQTQMRDIDRGYPAGPRGPGGFNSNPRSFSFEPPSSAAPAGAPRGARPPPRMPPAPPMQRPMPPKNKVISILDRARSAMETYPYDDGYSQPPEPPILTALNFYARGSYQGSVGQNMDGPMAQQTVSRCLQEVTTALNAPHIMRKYIKFPQNIIERNLIKQRFYQKYRLPGVIGCIDCTHIAIVRPSEHENEEQYFNRKHFHSLNTQVIRGPVRGAAPEPDFYYERSHDRYGGGGGYEDEGYGYKDDSRDYKSARAVGTRRQNPMQPQHHAPRHYARPEPYARPPK